MGIIKFNLITLIALIITCLMHFNATAETWTVDNDGKADFDNIQAAVDAASGGDVIVVMPGMYTSAQDGHVVNTLGKSVWIRSLSGAAVTTINGQFSRRGIACFNGENKNTIIEGFTITNCESVPFDYDGDGNPDEYWEAEIGGGIITKWSSPTIKNCIFTGNSATSAGGGGIFMTGNTTLIDCYFYSNYAGYGGGAMELYSGSPTIKNCVFEKNLVGGASYGSIYNAYSSATFENCDIRNNSRGFYVTSSNSTQYPTITNSNLCGNAGYQIKGEYYDGGGNTFANACDDLEQGACCIKDACYEVKLTSCLSSDGEWLGQDITCKEYSCIKPGPKTWTVDDDGKADFNNE